MSREETTREIIPDALEPYDEVLISKKSNNNRRYHLENEGELACRSYNSARFHKRELIQIVPTYTICTRCEDKI